MKESIHTLATRRSSGAFSKWLAAAALSALAVLPIGSSMTPVQADPPDHAPAWGYRRHDRDDNCDNDRNNRRHRDRDRDRDRWDNDRRDRDRWDNDRDNDRYGTVYGVVTNVKSNQRFRMRANGREFDVHSDSRLPRKLDRGDRVRVTGRFDDGNFQASDVDITDNN